MAPHCAPHRPGGARAAEAAAERQAPGAQEAQRSRRRAEALPVDWRGSLPDPVPNAPQRSFRPNRRRAFDFLTQSPAPEQRIRRLGKHISLTNCLKTGIKQQ